MKEIPIVLVTEAIADVGLRLLEESCQLRTPWFEGRAFSDDDLGAADAIIVRLVCVDEALLMRAPHLKVIGRHGAGLDNINLAAATCRRIPVVFTPDCNANAVAEHTVLMMQSLARQILAADRAVRDSQFNLRDNLIGFELRGKVLGIVGLGAIGSRVAEICWKAFEMQVLVFDPFVVSQPSGNHIVFARSLRELLELADVVTLHVPLTVETQYLINAEALSWMKRSALLINTARGAIVDTSALATTLKRGLILGAAIDVFEQEPLPPEHPLLSAPHTLFSPHIAGSTQESRAEMAKLIAEQVLQVLRGEIAPFIANPEACIR